MPNSGGGLPWFNPYGGKGPKKKPGLNVEKPIESLKGAGKQVFQNVKTGAKKLAGAMKG